MKYCYYEVSGKEKTIEDFKSTFINLSTNIFTSSDPIDAPKIKIGDIEFNSWKKFIETEDSTVKEFIKKYSEEFDDTISMILYGTCMLYAEFMADDKDLEIKLSELLKDKVDVDIFNGNPINLIIVGENDDIELPTIQLKF